MTIPRDTDIAHPSPDQISTLFIEAWNRRDLPTALDCFWYVIEDIRSSYRLAIPRAVEDVLGEAIPSDDIPGDVLDQAQTELADYATNHYGEFGNEPEFCGRCGQPDNTGDCDHTPLSPEEIDMLLPDREVRVD